MDMTDAPKRIWVEYGQSGPEAMVWVGGSTIGLRKLPCYILATPEALAPSPEVQKLVADAKAQGMERALGIMKTAGDSAVTEALGQRLCCNGQDCGCRGATVEEYLEHLIRAEVAAIRGETP